MHYVRVIIGIIAGVQVVCWSNMTPLDPRLAQFNPMWLINYLLIACGFAALGYAIHPAPFRGLAWIARWGNLAGIGSLAAIWSIVCSLDLPGARESAAALLASTAGWALMVPPLTVVSVLSVVPTKPPAGCSAGVIDEQVSRHVNATTSALRRSGARRVGL